MHSSCSYSYVQLHRMHISPLLPLKFSNETWPDLRKIATNDARGQLDFLKYSRSGDRNDPLNWKAKLESTWRAPPRSFVLPPDDLFLPKKRTQRRTWTASCICTYIYTYIYTRRSSGRPALFPSNRAEDWASDWVTYNPDRISLMIGHETPTHGSPPPSSGGGGGGREGWDLKIEALPYDRDVISTGRSRTLILLIVDTPPCVYRVYTCAWLSSMGTYVPFVHASTYVRTGIRY